MFGAWGFVTAFYVSKLNDISLVFSFFAGKRNIEWGILRKGLYIFLCENFGGWFVYIKSQLSTTLFTKKKNTIWHSLFEKMHLNFYLDFSTKTFNEVVFIFN